MQKIVDLAPIFDLLNDDLDYLDADKDFQEKEIHGNKQNSRRAHQLVKAIAEDESSLQEWIFDAYVIQGRIPPKSWDSKWMQHQRTNY